MVLQCARNRMENHLQKSMKSHLDLSNLEISRLKRVRFMKDSVIYACSQLLKVLLIPRVSTEI